MGRLLGENAEVPGEVASLRFRLGSLGALAHPPRSPPDIVLTRRQAIVGKASGAQPRREGLQDPHRLFGPPSTLRYVGAASFAIAMPRARKYGRRAVARGFACLRRRAAV